jgi:hypothetical protein
MLLTALSIAFFLQGNFERKFVFKTVRAPEEEVWKSLAELSRAEPDLPVVVDEFDYLSAVQYAPASLRDRLVDVADADMSLRFINTDSTEKTIELLAHFVPLRVEKLTSFEAAHPRFLVYSTYSQFGDSGWFAKYLFRNKYDFKLLSESNRKLIFIAQR